MNSFGTENKQSCKVVMSYIGIDTTALCPKPHESQCCAKTLQFRNIIQSFISLCKKYTTVHKNATQKG